MSETTRTAPDSTLAGLRTGKTKWAALGALGVAGLAFLAIAFGGIGSNLVYYWGPTELMASGDKALGATIRLGGLVVEGSIVPGAGASGVEFDVIDRKGAKVHVKSAGVPPQMFRENIGVVVEGTMTKAGYFESQRLMVSHSNEYRVPGEEYKGNMKDVMTTTDGLEGKAKR